MQIVISVLGGEVQDIFCSDVDAEVLLVDWDAEASDPDNEAAVIFPYGGSSLCAFVSRPNPQPLRALAGSDVEAAIEAADEPTLACGS